MDQKKAQDAVKGKVDRTWNTNGVPSRPIDKRWNQAGRVVRDTEKGEEK